MKDIIDNGNGLYTIQSEPGDCTRYDYFCIKYHDVYLFAPRNNSFRYPQKINYFTAKAVIEVENCIDLDSSLHTLLSSLSNKENCNPCTYIECCRTILEIHKND